MLEMEFQTKDKVQILMADYDAQRVLHITNENTQAE